MIAECGSFAGAEHQGRQDTEEHLLGDVSRNLRKASTRWRIFSE